MNSTQINYRKTVTGWFNVSIVGTGATYNVTPELFYAITGASKRAFVGCTEIDGAQLVALFTDRQTRRLPQLARKAVV